MNTTSSTRMVFFWVWMLCSSVSALSSGQLQTGLHTFWRSDGPNSWAGGPGTGPGTDPNWIPAGQGTSPPITVPANGSVHFAFANQSDSNNRKSVTVIFKVNNHNDLYYLRLGQVKGFNDQTNNSPVQKASGQRRPRYHLLTPQLQINAFYEPQPEWETIELKNIKNSSIDVEVLSADSNCSNRHRSTGANGV